MKLKKLHEKMTQAQEALQAAQVLALEARQKAKAAKGRFQQAKLEHKRSRKEARAAKEVALEAAKAMRAQTCLVFKLEKRLARALKKQNGKRVFAVKTARRPVARPVRLARRTAVATARPPAHAGKNEFSGHNGAVPASGSGSAPASAVH